MKMKYVFFSVYILLFAGQVGNMQDSYLMALGGMLNIWASDGPIGFL